MAEKKYASVDSYEKKLDSVMSRLNVKDFEYDWTRKTAYIRFNYKGKQYQFDHSVDKANANAKTAAARISYGTDVFAQLVLALEDLARIVERGIYDLDVWVKDLLYIEEKPEIPYYFQFFGFNDMIPGSIDDIQPIYKALIKEKHPDSPNGDREQFDLVQSNYSKCQEYYKIF